MIDFPQLERNLNIIRRDEGFIGGSLKLNTLEDAHKNIEAEISFKHFYIKFNINPNLDEMWNNDKNIQDYCRVRKIDNNIEDVCKTVFLHEIWHWKKEELVNKIGCPTDNIHLAKIVDSSYKALKEKGFFGDINDEDQRRSYAFELAKMFEDVVVNTNLSYENIDRGLSIVYYGMGKQNEAYSTIGEAYLKLQMSIFGSEEDKKLVRTFYTRDQEKQKSIDEVVDKTLTSMDLKNTKIKDVITKFRTMGTWENLAYNFVYNMSDLIDRSQGSEEFGMALSISDRRGNSKDISSGKSKEKGSEEEKEASSNNSKEDKSKKDYMEEGIAISLDHNLSEKDEKEILAHYYANEAGPPNFMDKKRVLKLTYDNLASKVTIRAKAEEEGFEMPLTPFRHEPFDVDEHEIQEIDFSKPVIDFESPFNNHINFLVPSDSYNVITPYSKKNERLPDIMWLIDCSGTMNDGYGDKVFNIRDAWREDSKYHYALLGVFGSIKWLKSQQIAPYLKYNIVLFSDTTRNSGWHGYHELEKSLDVLWKPEFGGTNIDMNVLKPDLNVNPAVIVFMTDGGIWNWDPIKSDFRSSIDKHFVSYIQIKDKTQTGEDLEKWGKEVYDINNSGDLQDLIIDLTKQSYSKILRL